MEGYVSKLLVWSAFDESGVARLRGDFQTYLDESEIIHSSEAGSVLHSLAYTLANRRTVLPWKSFMIADSLEGLRKNVSSEMSKAVRASTKPTLLFVFTGQGAVWHAMGRELNYYPVFHSSLKGSEAALHDLGCKWSLLGRFFFFNNLKLQMAPLIDVW